MNINDFELYIDELILKRGRDYYESGNIISLEYYGDEWIANVEGSDDYTVVAVLSADNEILYSECDCPYDWGEYCKHKAAVFYSVRDKIKSGEVLSEPMKKKNTKGILENLSKRALASIILDFTEKGIPIKEEDLLHYAENDRNDRNDRNEKAAKSVSAFKRRVEEIKEKEEEIVVGDAQITDWQKSMNKAVDYIERNLADEIDYSAAARYMNCSVWEFQRLFSFMAQVPLSEYIRRRRLTLAAHDIQIRSEKDKIIDVALRYGYDSHASFSRAFTQLHGTMPKSARDNGVTLKIFPRLDFQFADKDIEPVNYRIEQKEPFQVIGITKNRFTITSDKGVYDGGIGKLWAYWYYNKMKERFYIKYAKDAKHDMCVSLPANEAGELCYTVGFLYNGAENTDGFSVADVPGGTYIVFDIPEEYADDSRSFMRRCATEYIPATGYDLADVEAEYFSDFPGIKKSEAWFLVG